ncbi:MarR family winged helix-turn-helix transcriptional regulator [Coleofasciculus sp. E1-EBD-02]|jgi:DNA-binding MarR family transcriptional regulator|uniref:MarR family winged helix-turn-helix transcriptional regulator n=1 Tax=unclassified Coleofasciculus TaxID=2692782 RepID=UPI0032F4BED0
MLELEDFPNSETLKVFAARFPELDISALQTWLTLMHVSGEVVSYLEDYLSDYGLSQRKFFILILLARNPNGLNISQLAEKTGVSCASITGVVDRMKKANLVTREEDSRDRRVMVVRLAQAGETLLEKVLPDHYRRVAELMSSLNQQDRHSLQTLLERIRLNLR